MQGFKSHTAGSNNRVPCALQSVFLWNPWTLPCRNVLVCASRSKSGDVRLERGIFDYIVSSRKIKEAARERPHDEEDAGLIPQQWLTLQDNLHKTKSEKKLDLRLQAIENSMRIAAELQQKRQKLENTSILSKGRVVHSTCSNQKVALDSLKHPVEEHIEVRPETMATLKVKEDTISSQSCPTEKKRKFDSELDRWFSEDEIACLKRSVPDLTKIYRDKWPPLQVLVASGQFFLLDEFLKSHVDINSFDEDGYTPIHRAVLGRKETAVSQLLRARADVNILDKDGASFLHYSVQIGSLNLVRLFVKCGVDVNHSDENGWTALHVAALTGREDIVRHLLVSGADKHRKTKEGHTPLDLCLAMGKGYRTFAVAKNLKRLPRESMPSAAELELEEGPTARE